MIQSANATQSYPAKLDAGAVSFDQEKNVVSSSLYPNAALPLMPNALLYLVGSRSVISLDGKSRLISEFATLGCSDFSAEDLEFSCEQIAEVVQTLLYSKKSLPHLSRVKIDIPDGLRLSQLVLSDRARIALQTRDFFRPSGPWRHCSLQDLVSIQAFGSKLLLAFLLAIEHGIRNIENDTPSNASHIEDDLQLLAEDVLYANRSADVFICANGWDGGGERVLMDIRDRHAISKERARQILAMSESAMRRHMQFAQEPSRLRIALDILEHASPISTDHAQKTLFQKGLSRVPFHPHGILTAARLFGIETNLSVCKFGRLSIVARPSERMEMESIQTIANSMARSFGLVSDQWVHEHLIKSEKFTTLEMVHLALASDAQLSALLTDSVGRQWFWPGRSEKPTGSIVRPLKLIAFFGGINLTEILADMQSNVAMLDLHLPGPIGDEVLCALLSMWDISEDARGLWCPAGKAGRDACRIALPAVEEKVATIVQQAGGSLSKVDLQAIAGLAHINSNTLQSYIRRSPLFSRSERRSLNISLAVNPNNLGIAEVKMENL